MSKGMGKGGRKSTALVGTAKLTPAWEPDPPGPLSSQTVQDKYLLPMSYSLARPELAVGVCLGTVAALPFIFFSLPMWGFFATFIGVLGGARLYSNMHLRSWRRGMAEAFDKLEKGDYDGAENTFRAVALKQRDPLLRSASADFGYLALRRGDFDGALAIYSRAWRAPGIGSHARAAVGVNLALCFAAMGELEASEQWLPKADTGQTPFYTPSSAAYVTARLGRYQDATDFSLPELESWQEVFVRHERRVLYLMRAFAMQMLGESEDLVLAHASVAEPAYPGEFDYLTSHWDELDNFVQEKVVSASSFL